MNLRTLVARLRPDRTEAVDLAVAVALSLLGVVGFRTTFSGGEELVVGIPAVLVGALLGLVLAKTRPPLLAGVAVGVGTFFVLGGAIALRDRAPLGFLPSPAVFSGLADGLVNGWIRLLTTLPPAGRAGDLLTIPYLCGFAGGAITVVLALRLAGRQWCILPPIVVLAVSVLMGTKRPASLLLQGVVFAAVTLAWVAVRHHRSRSVDTISSRPTPSRLATAAALLVVATVGGSVLGPRLPGADADDRYVLREEVEPPFDPLTEPSPLASYRNYTDQDVREDEVLTATGLPAGAHLRIAVMDEYSGTEWRATGSGSVVAGEYLRVGAEIPSEGRGAAQEVDIEIHQPEGVWVPLAGDVTSISFQGPDGDRLDDEVRVSIETDTAAVPSELREGDRYRFTAEFVDLPGEDILVETPLDPRVRRQERDDVPVEFVSRASDWAKDQPTEFAEALAIADALQSEGAYSDGGPDANPVSPPGHSLRRLLDFITIEQPFGNGEQFAAAQGLLAQARGIPVRVAMGFVNEAGDDEVTFRGEDIEAWIEVPVEGYGWVPIDGTPPEDQLPDPLKQPRSKTENPEPQPPPPTTIAPPTSIPDELEPEEPEEDEDDDESGSAIPGWLVAAAIAVGLPAIGLGLPSLVIVALKRRRRRRRRTTGPPFERIAGAFRELVDNARDSGRPVPPRATRHELSQVVGVRGATALAGRADAAVFGDGDPGDGDVDGAWQDYEASRADLYESMGRRERIFTAVNVTSLRRR